MTKAQLQDRLAKVQAELAKTAKLRESLTAQLNALVGREAELTELLALCEDRADEPTGAPV